MKILIEPSPMNTKTKPQRRWAYFASGMERAGRRHKPARMMETPVYEFSAQAA